MKTFQSGDPYLLGVQLLAAVTIIIWTGVTSFIILKTIDIIIGLRVSSEQETLGADLVEHDVGNGDFTYDKVTNQITWLRHRARSAHSSDECNQVRAEVLQTTVDECNLQFVNGGNTSIKHANNHPGNPLETCNCLEDIDDRINRNNFRTCRTRASGEKHTLGKRITMRKCSPVYSTVSTAEKTVRGFLGKHCASSKTKDRPTGQNITSSGTSRV